MQKCLIYVKFTAAAFAVQIMIWLIFCHLIPVLAHPFILLILLPSIPTALYIKFGSYFTDGHRLIETILHTALWLVTSTATAYLCRPMVHDEWGAFFFSITSILCFAVLTPLAKFFGFLMHG